MTETPTIRALLLLARTLAVRQVRVADDGIEFVDRLGRTTRPTIDGKPIVLPPGTLGELFADHRLYDPGDVQEKDGIEWVLGEENGVRTIKPKTPFPATLDAVATFDPEQLAAFRSMYRRSGVSVRLFVDGETRVRDALHAIAAERAMVGLPSNGDVPYRDYYSSWNARPPMPAVDQADAPAWTYALDRRGRGEPRPEADVVAEIRPRHMSPGRPLLAGHDDQGVPTVAIDIALVDSKPVGRIEFSAAALPLLDPESAQAPELPWSMIAAESARRKAALPKRERTWLPTTAKVAEAFVEGVLPRGYAGGKSLYFHGPIAYSSDDKNPVAAFVTAPDGRRVLIQGRTYDGDGVTSMAIADIRSVLPEDVPVIGLGDLREVLTFAGVPADRVPSRFKRDKNERDFARTAAIDPEGLAKWLAEGEAEARREIEASHRSSALPTLRKIESFHRLLRIDELAQRVADLLGVPAPRIQDAAEIRQDMEYAVQAQKDREAELEARRTARSPAA